MLLALGLQPPELLVRLLRELCWPLGGHGAALAAISEDAMDG